MSLGRRFHIVFFPSGGGPQPHVAPLPHSAKPCGTEGSGHNDWVERQLSLGGDPPQVVLLRLPPRLREVEHPVIAEGVCTFDPAPPMWHWVEGATSATQLALSLWADAREGYPAVGVLHGTRCRDRVDCRVDLREGTLSLVEFCLEFSDAPSRYFVAASLSLGDGRHLKAIAHAATQAATKEAMAILGSSGISGTLGNRGDR